MRRRPIVRAVLLFLFVLPALAGETVRISVGPDGQQSDGLSSAAGISKSGRFVTLFSDATNLVADDTNEARDVFLHDRKKGRTVRVSVSTEGAEGNGGSAWSVISGNGRFVAFSSGASNLVEGDTNEVADIFVHDRKRRTTERVSVSTEGAQSDAGASWISLSKNGRFVLFRTKASTLVPGDTNGRDDLFLHDRRRGTTDRVSVGPDGTEGDGNCLEGKLSPDGRRVVFTSTSTNRLPGSPDGLQHVYVLDRKKGTLRRVSVDSEGNPGNGDCYHPRISPCGRWVAFISSGNDLVPDDTNGWHDLFLHDLKEGVTTRLSLTREGGQTNGDTWRPNLSARAKYIAFYSYSANLVEGDTNDERDVFLYRR